MKEAIEVNRKILGFAMALILLVVAVGSAIAAYTWISNQIHTTVTVTPYNFMTVTGSFPTTQNQHVPWAVSFDYTVNIDNPTGYIIIILNSTSFTDNSGAYIGGQSPGVTVTPTGGSALWCAPITSYPQYSSGAITFVFGYNGNAIPFGTTTGKIDLGIRCDVAGTVNATMQISSTLP